MELYRLCYDESERLKVLIGYECEKGAYCNTNHHLVCVKLKFGRKYKTIRGILLVKMRRFHAQKLDASKNNFDGCLVTVQHLESV